MSDIPEHLIDAWMNAEPRMRPTIHAILAALRPEDAHLVPAWKAEQAAFADSTKRTSHLVDEARAEVEDYRSRLAGGNKDYIALSKRWDEAHTEVAKLGILIKSLVNVWKTSVVEVKRLKAQVADYEHRINWGTTCKNCAGLLDRLYEGDQERDRLKAENEQLRQSLEGLSFTFTPIEDYGRD